MTEAHIRQNCGVLATQEAWAEVTYKQTDYNNPSRRGLIILLQCSKKN